MRAEQMRSEQIGGGLNQHPRGLLSEGQPSSLKNQSPIENRFMEQGALIEHLNIEVERLADRVHLVMLDDPRNQAKKPSAPEPVMHECLLESKIRGANARLQDSITLIRQINEQIQL